MRRRQFLTTSGMGAATFLFSASRAQTAETEQAGGAVVIGGGLGGCAATLALLQSGLKVVWSEETDWIGGQLTAQAVPPDEHRWIETHGATRQYRELRHAIRDYYRRHYPLTQAAAEDPALNPGRGSVSRLCHEPRVALAALQSLFAPYLSSGQLTLLLDCEPTRAEVDGDQILAIHVRHRFSGHESVLRAPYFVDATELGDLLPLTGTEYVKGAESQKETNEIHAPGEARPDNHQAFTMCFAVDHVPGENHTIDPPESYSFWRDYEPRLTPPWPGRLLGLTYTHPRSMEPRKLGFHPENGEHGGILNLWKYRRITAKETFADDAFRRDVTLVNWPQNDYWLGSLIDVSGEEKARHLKAAKQLSLSLLYWLQTEVPRADGKQGFPGLRLRGDLLGTDDGLAKAAYVRESRRIRALFTVTEAHCGVENRARVLGVEPAEARAMPYADSVGVGSYSIDLHPTTGGVNYIDFPSLPFQIPLGALIPQRVVNLLPACKNIGTTHITNGCYRLHPVEWNIGESVGHLVAFAAEMGERPVAIREGAKRLEDLQARLTKAGVELAWPA